MTLITLLLFVSFSSLAQERDRQEAAEKSKLSANYELEAEKIIDIAEEKKIATAKTHEKDIQEIAKKVDEVKQQKSFKESQDWINKNQNKLFAKQAQALPKIDYNITKEERQKDAIADLLHNYRFKPDEVKKASITHYPLMIFVSSSIPKSALKDLMIQAKQGGGILVFRGIIGSLRNTQQFLADISKENVSAIIDPRLFDIFQIQLVPTFVVLSDVVQDCQNNDCQFTPVHDRITGNITLKYALEQIKSGRGDAAKTASIYLAKIGGGEK
jgi:type-F conjugative transfer system pilin assembly protein TrbC